MKFKTLKSIFVIFILAISILLGIPRTAEATGISRIYYTTDTNITVGQDFNIYVNADNLTDLFGDEVDFSFDPTLIQVNSIQAGSFYSGKVDGIDYKLVTPATKTVGFASAAIVLLGNKYQTGLPVPANSQLFVIKAHALKAGTIALKTITDNSILSATGNNVCVKLVDSNKGQIGGITYEVGSVNITSFNITSLTSDKPSPIFLGDSIKFTTLATGSSTIQYKFVTVVNGSTYLLKDFDSNNYVNFKPGSSNSYKIITYAKDVNSGLIISKELNFVVIVPFKITSLTSDKTSPISLGDIIKFTTEAIGSTTVKYKFVTVVNGSTYLLKDFDATNYVIFKPGSSNTYKIIAFAKDVNTGIIVSTELTFSVVVNAPFNITTLTPDKTSPITLGDTIKFTTVATGSTNIQYKFVTVVNGSTYILKDFDATNTVSWKPGSINTYKIIAFAKDVATGLIVSKEINFVVNPITVAFNITTLTTDKTSPITLGDTIKFTTVATGSTNIQYKFVTVVNGSTYILKNFDATNSVSWKPGSINTYKIIAYAKDVATGLIISKEINFVVNPITVAFNITTLTIDKTSPITLGDTIKFTTVATGSTNIQYKFVTVVNGSTYILKDFDATNAVSWKPGSINTYKIIAYAKDVATGLIVSKEITLVVNPIAVAFNITTLTTDKASPITLGDTIRFTTVATGSTNIQYKFVTVVNGSTYILKDFDSTNSVSWKPGSINTYKIIAYAKHVATGLIVSKEINFVINSITAAFNITALTTDKTSPITLGDTIKFTTVATGSTNIHYKFVTIVNGNTYILKDFDSTNSVSWKPGSINTYKIIAYAKNVATGLIVSKEINILINPIGVPLVVVPIS